eukprot:CAMPEP_0184976868 /NCGR_PEP_ID=MMETSP1098-20130426/7732_1 /TAXON_ID=89044 /ORGANISM="Spumella elongata, Strain CCAP 955/1" /LENGTH=290 /DNA_ID=CAMNT_0027499807 /DNA_START=108 /DNA_END=980 /DNA_ORIENTATION=-
MGGLVATVALYPLELIKTRMQVISDSAGTYRSLTRSFREVLRNEGVKGLYQGMSPALLGASGSWGGYFYFYEKSKERKARRNLSSGGTSTLQTFDHLSSGVEAGVMLVLLFNPVWVVKTRLALQGAESTGHAKYNGSIDCVRTIWREEGIRGLYKGLFPALLLTSHGAIQFAIYESFKKFAQKYQTNSEELNKQPAWVSATIGGSSKIIASTITYPYQLVKSKLQQRDGVNASTQLTERRYTGTWDCVQKVWRSEGAVGFFRGVIPNSLKVAPSAALTFLVYEEVLKLMR